VKLNGKTVVDNVVLESGYQEIETPYGRGVSIDNLDALNSAIGKWLLTVPKLLTGAELRFLRHELDMSQGRLAHEANRLAAVDAFEERDLIGSRLDPGWGILAGHVVFLAALLVRPQGLFPRTRD
jgi:DNA-binding transcriptional regulator YiaG